MDDPRSVSAGAIARPPWTMAAVATECLEHSEMNLIPFLSRGPKDSLLEQNIYSFIPFELQWINSFWFLRCLQGMFLLIPVQHTWFLFNSINIFTNDTSFCPNFYIVPSGQKLFFSQIFLLYLLPAIHAINLAKNHQHCPCHSLNVKLPLNFLHQINSLLLSISCSVWEHGQVVDKFSVRV